MKPIYFERAIFLSWYCSKGDCKFCYMSTQKDKIKNPKLAKRTIESVLAEAVICNLLNLKIEFISGGYESYEFDELIEIINKIHQIYKKKLWLNLGTLSFKELEQLKPYNKGVCGTIECINFDKRDNICPSKPIKDIEIMFENCDKLGLKKSITIILGIEETLDNFNNLKTLINKNKIEQITFYRLKAQKNTIYENNKPISSNYFESWIKKTRKEFPDIKIIVGSWIGHLNEFTQLINAGADSITKFPVIKKFNSKEAKIIEKSIQDSNNKFASNLTKKIKFNKKEIEAMLPFKKELNEKIIKKIKQYGKKIFL